MEGPMTFSMGGHGQTKDCLGGILRPAETEPKVVISQETPCYTFCASVTYEKESASFEWRLDLPCDRAYAVGD